MRKIRFYNGLTQYPDHILPTPDKTHKSSTLRKKLVHFYLKLILNHTLWIQTHFYTTKIIPNIIKIVNKKDSNDYLRSHVFFSYMIIGSWTHQLITPNLSFRRIQIRDYGYDNDPAHLFSRRTRIPSQNKSGKFSRARKPQEVVQSAEFIQFRRELDLNIAAGAFILMEARQYMRTFNSCTIMERVEKIVIIQMGEIFGEWRRK